MDGLLRSEFALVLRDSFSPTPRRHAIAPPLSPTSPPPSRRCGGSGTLSVSHGLPTLPTSPISPLPRASPLPSSTPALPPLHAPTAASVAATASAAPLALDVLVAVSLGQSSVLPSTPMASTPLSSTPLSSSASLSTCPSLSSPTPAPRSPRRKRPRDCDRDEQQQVLPTTPQRKRRALPFSPGTPGRSSNAILSNSTTVAPTTAGTSNSTGTARVFSCTQCPSTFSQQFNLNKHVRAVHERRRPFQCHVCHARFQQKSHRTMHHLAVHEKLRQFACDQCHSSFSWRGVLKKHRKSIHGIDE